MSSHEAKNRLREYLFEAGLRPAEHLIIHSSFRKIKEAFPGITPEEVIETLKEISCPEGSLVFPAFTYCFKKRMGSYEVFDRLTSPSKTGILSEVFRKSAGVKRTSSPTHSFLLWGKASEEIDSGNSPESPLGAGSVMEWLAQAERSYVLMPGTDFTSLTIGHYIEIVSKLPYLSLSSWNHLNVLSCGASNNGTQQLKEIPGCSRGFIKFEKYLSEHGYIEKFSRNGLESYYLNIKTLLEHGRKYLKENPSGLLCTKGTCPACDERHNYFLEKEGRS